MKNGGSAFPEITSDRGKNGKWEDTYSYGGMTLRDWFAGHALAGLLNSYDDTKFKTTCEVMAGLSYKLADAMLAEKENTK